MLATRSDLLLAKERIYYSIRDAYLEYQKEKDTTAQPIVLKEFKLSSKFSPNDLEEFCKRPLKIIETQIAKALDELNPFFGFNRAVILFLQLQNNTDGRYQPILKFAGSKFEFTPDLTRAESNETIAAKCSPDLQTVKDNKIKKIASKMEVAINSLKSEANTALGGIKKALDERFLNLPDQKNLHELSLTLIMDISQIFKTTIANAEIECSHEKLTGSGKFFAITSKVSLFMNGFLSETKIANLANYLLLTYNKTVLINTLTSCKKIFPELCSIKSFTSLDDYFARLDEFEALANFNSLLLTNDTLDKSKAYINLYMDLMSELELLKANTIKINNEIQNQYISIKENQLFDKDSGLYLKLEGICDAETNAAKMQELDLLIQNMQASCRALLINTDANLRLENFNKAIVEAGISKNKFIDFQKPRKDLLEQGLTTEKRKIEILYVDELPEIVLDLPKVVELVSKFKINKETEYKLAQIEQDLKFETTQYYTSYSHYNEVKKSITSALSSSFSNSTQDSSIKRLMLIREDCQKYAQAAIKFQKEHNVIVSEINDLASFRLRTLNAHMEKYELQYNTYKNFITKLRELDLLNYHGYNKYKDLPLFVFGDQYKNDLIKKLKLLESNLEKINNIYLEILDTKTCLSLPEIEFKSQQIDKLYLTCNFDIITETTINDLILVNQFIDDNALLLAQSKYELPEFDKLNLQHQLVLEYNAYHDAMQKVFTVLPNEIDYTLTLKTLEKNQQQINQQYEINCNKIKEKIENSNATLSKLVSEFTSLKEQQFQLDDKIRLDRGAFDNYAAEIEQAPWLNVTNQYYNSCKIALSKINDCQLEVHDQITNIDNAISRYQDKSVTFDDSVYQKLLDDNKKAEDKHGELWSLNNEFRNSTDCEYFTYMGCYVKDLESLFLIEDNHLAILYKEVIDFVEKCSANEHLDLSSIDYKNAKTSVERNAALQNIYEFSCRYLPKYLELQDHPKLINRQTENNKEINTHEDWEQTQHTATLSCLRVINRLCNPSYREQAYHTVNPAQQRNINSRDFIRPHRHDDGLPGGDDKPPYRSLSSVKSHLPPVPPKIKKSAWTVFKQHMGKIIGSISGIIIGGGVGAFLGFFLMPVTLGISLPVGAAIGVLVGGAVGGGLAGLGIGSLIDNCCWHKNANQVEKAVVSEENPNDDIGNIHKRFPRKKSYSFSKENNREDISDDHAFIRSHSDPVTVNKSKRFNSSRLMDHVESLDNCDINIQGLKNSKGFSY